MLLKKVKNEDLLKYGATKILGGLCIISCPITGAILGSIGAAVGGIVSPLVILLSVYNGKDLLGGIDGRGHTTTVLMAPIGFPIAGAYYGAEFAIKETVKLGIKIVNKGDKYEYDTFNEFINITINEKINKDKKFNIEDINQVDDKFFVKYIEYIKIINKEYYKESCYMFKYIDELDLNKLYILYSFNKYFKKNKKVKNGINEDGIKEILKKNKKELNNNDNFKKDIFNCLEIFLDNLKTI